MSRTRTKKTPATLTDSRTRIPWQWPTVVLVIAAIVAASAYAVLRHGSTAGRGTLLFAEIEHTPLPPHVPESFLREVQTAGGFGAIVDLGDASKVLRIREAFARHPWVRTVEHMDTSKPDRLHVSLRFRTPVAVVTRSGLGMFLDEQGARLPPPRGSADVVSGLLRLEGDVAPPRGEPGQSWGAPAVEAAARLAGLLAPERQRFGLVAIEIDEAALEPELRLRTTGGSRVIWQTLPHDRGANPVSVEEKLARLAAYCEQHGSLEKPAGPYVLDVRPPGGITRQPRKERR